MKSICIKKNKITKKKRNDELIKMIEFPDYNSIKHGDLLGLSLSTNTTQFTHGIHRFPAKYIPQVPRWAIGQFCDYDSVVLDPFMGSGTTLVEGLCTVKETYGLDIDPLARLITKAKTTNYNFSILEKCANEILSNRGGTIIGDDFPMGGVQNPIHWFGKENKEYLNFLFDAILNLGCGSNEKEFFLCVFSSVLRWVSNADDQSQKTYVSGTRKKNPPNAWIIFERFLKKALDGVKSLIKYRHENSKAKVLTGDALNIPFLENTVDLIVTSPPYVDSVDYMYNSMLEYFWLGPMFGLKNRKDFNELRKETIGAKNPIKKFNKLPDPIENMVSLDKIPDYRKYSVSNYFHSMHEHFKEASRVLRNNGKYVLVVGNSQSANGIMPIHDCLTKLANGVDLKIEKAFAYRIRRHYMKFPRKGRGGIILMDWIITFKKTSDKSPYEGVALPIPSVTIGHDEVAN